jgi:hypothetical protein
VPESELCYHDDTMNRDHESALSELAAAVARARVPGLADVFIERRAEVCWRLADGRITAREALLREGAAMRRNGTLVSTDGLDRPVLARMLGITSRGLPSVPAPPYPAPPTLEDVTPHPPAGWASVRWGWRWAAVLTGRRAVPIHRPDLAEVTTTDGHRALTVWPPAPNRVPDATGDGPLASARTGKVRVLLAPAAAAVLLHELIGHPLEGDLLMRRASPWSGKQGERLTRLGLSVSDDPTRTDLPGAFSGDDEGEPARPRVLLAAGVLAGALANRESAAALGVAPGNARRATVHVHPRPRMSNLVATAAEPLPHPPRHEAAIEVTTLASGTVEPASGSILLHVRAAFGLRRGERHRPLAPFTLVGSVAAVCDGLLAAAEPTLPVAEPGWCAKDGEVVPTGAVAPWLLLSGLEVR